MREKTGLTVGFSDHSEGDLAILASYLLGSEIMEFHFTDSRKRKKFRDHKVSLTSKEVLNLNNKISQINMMKGSKFKKITFSEKSANHSEIFRRAIYPARDIKAGEKITKKDFLCLRPNIGLDAREINKILNKRFKKNFYKFEKIKLK